VHEISTQIWMHMIMCIHSWLQKMEMECSFNPRVIGGDDHWPKILKTYYYSEEKQMSVSVRYGVVNISIMSMKSLRCLSLK